MSPNGRAAVVFTAVGVVLAGAAVALTHGAPEDERAASRIASGAPSLGAAAPPSLPPSTSSADAAPKYPDYPSETPATFTQTYAGWDYARREIEIPMRDGVKLHTVVVVPRGATRAPMLLTRTPYDADRFTGTESVHMDVAMGSDVPPEALAEGGYIRVVQDVRGKHGSEGDYVMNRPVHGPENSTPVDHATDTWDTIDWLVKNVPESNGNVGIVGTSYDGFTAAMALYEPHPALKVAVPMNPMVDGWHGDDWFHGGAFRQFTFEYVYGQEATRQSKIKWPSAAYDEYSAMLEAGSAGDMGRRLGLDQLGFWQKLVAHPSYDAFWRDQAVDRLLADRPLRVPTMIVHSLWDQEDIYGAPALYRALEAHDTRNDRVFLVLGPWCHGGWNSRDGSTLGAIRFDEDTSRSFRRDVLLPFLDHYLKDGAPPMDVAPVTAFETGTNRWRRLRSWPAGCEAGCTTKKTPLHLHPGGGAGWDAPQAAGFDEYVSDPAKPVPYIPRPVVPVATDEGRKAWREWLVSDQRNVASRPDVLVYATDPLTAPVKVVGEPQVHLVASTSGTDSDWIVKLVDVYPPEVRGHPELGGYELPVAMDVFRGRYRESLETPRPLAAGEPLAYGFGLPDVNHVFLPGHRIMIQVQSTWFPLYDRNPQTFVPSIFDAKPGDYRKATQRVYWGAANGSFVDVNVVTP